MSVNCSFIGYVVRAEERYHHVWRLNIYLQWIANGVAMVDGANAVKIVVEASKQELESSHKWRSTAGMLVKEKQRRPASIATKNHAPVSAIVL